MGEAKKQSAPLYILAALAIAGGLGLVAYGGDNYGISSRASSTPEDVDLAELERTGGERGTFVRVGAHWRLYGGGVYLHEERSGDVKAMYYPIVSSEHPFVRELEPLLAKYGHEGNIPPPLRPDVEKFAILVQTNRFKYPAQIPAVSARSRSLQGVISGHATSVPDGVEKELRRGYPNMDLSRVLVLKEEATPIPVWQAVALMVAGALLTPAGLVFLIVLMRRDHRRIRESMRTDAPRSRVL